MGESFLTSLSMDNYYPSTFLSMEPASSGTAAVAAAHEDSERELMIYHRQQISLSLPAPDINLPLSADSSTPPPSWSSDSCEILDLSPHMNEVEATVLHHPKVCSRKCTKKGDSFWGAWFFFNFYFKPLLSEKSKAKITHDESGFSGFDKSDLKVDVFLVQHDMENMYMWVFKERPDNALGKMQLRSYMNGHSRLGESQFPFSVEKGFARSHRMQRKHYKGLSNPQCIHGIEVVRLPNLTGVPEDDRKKWMELTGRDLNFPIPPEACDFGSWRNLPVVDIEHDKPAPLLRQGSSRRLLNVSGLNLLNHDHDSDVMDLSLHSNKRRKDSSFPHAMEEDCCLPAHSYSDRPQDMEIHPIEPSWIHDFTGVMRHACGPVTAAKTIYEDDKGYLIMVSLPLSDQHRVKVCWRNDLTHGIVKISCVSTSRMPFIKRHDRTFKLTDPSPEHCPPGEFVREISLATRIHEDSKIEAYYDETGTILEIMVPKYGSEPEEHEVHVSLRPPHLGTNDLMLT
ncbi:uncharacterized protein LOC110099950 [Dendrobium catenatum]|uniref:HSP20-like chaperones superfamily protein n=1 Tax=Dendrobium catenatum TaxID=906689 RepID=A0A2I0X4M5_9ASPA|nr:uncharacterized protein LOC110099950 [Dendrobium catenatum]PKU82869.1 hypothetical protein MA16_Dca006167 [Dendrobium catenatum]